MNVAKAKIMLIRNWESSSKIHVGTEELEEYDALWL